MEFLRCGTGHAVPNLGHATAGEVVLALCGAPGRLSSDPFDDQSGTACEICLRDVLAQLKAMHGSFDGLG